jgi:hypothetical protein
MFVIKMHGMIVEKGFQCLCYQDAWYDCKKRVSMFMLSRCMVGF